MCVYMYSIQHSLCRSSVSLRLIIHRFSCDESLMRVKYFLKLGQNQGKRLTVYYTLKRKTLFQRKQNNKKLITHVPERKYD